MDFTITGQNQIRFGLAAIKGLGEAALEFKVLDTLKPKEGEEGTAAEDLKALEKIWREELLGRGWKAY